MANVNLTPQDIDYIGRVVATEVPRSIARRNPQTYKNMVGAVVDTITNRYATGRYGKTIPGVLNQRRAFSKITGPTRLSPYGSVQQAPTAPTSVQRAVEDHIAARAAGAPSLIGGALDYANPNFSDAKNRRSWVDPMINAGATMLGVGNAVHYHGLAPGNQSAPDYSLSADFGDGRVLTAQSLPSVPALSYLPSKEAISPNTATSAPTAAAWGGTAAPKSALGAIEAIAPSGALSPSRPTESIVGQYADMSRYAPQAPAGPTAMAAAQTRPALDAALANPTARQEDTNFGGINPSSMMNENFPGLSMPAAPTGPTGAETLYSKAQDPATFAGALAAAQPQQAPPSVPSAPPSALYSPTSLATTPSALGAVPTAIGAQPATPMGLAAPGVGALPQLNVPSQMMAPPALQAPPATPPALQAPPAAWASESQSFPDAPAAPPSYTPSDIYGGQVGTATANDGNTVGRDPFGATTVTNKHGVTTAMTPTGKQSAYGPGFDPVGGLLGGAMFGGQKMSEKTKGMLAGAAMGALAGGLPGALAGGMLGRQVGGYVGKNSFPSAPSKANDRSGVAGGDRTAAERASRSPSAAASMGRNSGMTGLW